MSVFSMGIDDDYFVSYFLLGGLEPAISSNVVSKSIILTPVTSKTSVNYTLDFVTVLASVSLDYALLHRVTSNNDIVYSLHQSVFKAVLCDFSLTTPVSNQIVSYFDINQNNTVSSKTVSAFDLLSAPVTVDLQIDAVMSVNGLDIDIISASISQDEESWTWSFSANISDQIGWAVIKPSDGNYPICSISFRGVQFDLIIEGARRTLKDVSNSWQVSGRGINARLDGKHSAGIDINWRNVKAKAIIQHLCDAVGITLQYLTVDWLIKELDGQGRYPIEIINEIATAVGAIVQTTVDGQLIIRPRYVGNPKKYSDLTPDFIITDTDDYVTLDEQWIDGDNYNSISIGDMQLDSDQTKLNITSEDDGQNKLVKIYSVPFIDEIQLDDSSEGSLLLVYQGVMQVPVEVDAVEIVEGHASLSLPFYSLISYDYIHADLGALTIKENGDISTATKGQSLVSISYMTKYHQYLVIRTGNDSYLQIFAEVQA